MTVPLPDPTHWPRVEENPNGPVKYNVHLGRVDWPFVRRELVTLQGLLALYGLRWIDLEHHEVVWTPETDEEANALQLRSFSSRLEPQDPDAAPLVDFDLIARSVDAIESAPDIELSLNFFRRGMLDIASGAYIEAIYDFYFVLEREFAAGHFKKNAVARNFRSSNDLRNYIHAALIDRGAVGPMNNQTRKAFLETYGSSSVDRVIDRIIELRGRLHHSPPKVGKAKPWHPDDQASHAADAIFLQAVAFQVVFNLARPYVFPENPGPSVAE
ncbi:MAG: hypothetical protein HY749_20305 [Gammaproteobacteria bacterium]|nr:hypothetical protein [Gammaproteobacteria bacterium]